MLIFLSFLGIVTFLLSTRLPTYVADFATPIHQACQRIAPVSLYSSDYKALVCGSHLVHDTLRTELSDAGLLHLMIVSGFHLLFLERILRRILVKQTSTGWFIWPLLMLFTLANQFEVRIVRAFLGVAISRINEDYQLRWNPAQIVTSAGFLALPFCTTANSVFGLLTSWTAALAVTGFSAHFPNLKDESKLNQRIALQSRLYLLLAPLLLRMTLPGPFSILFNVSMAPVLGFILFPASLLAFLIPPLVPVTDFLWATLTKLINVLSFLIPAPVAQNIKVPLYALALYLMALTACAGMKTLRENQ
jgi:hypothetical protein